MQITYGKIRLGLLAAIFLILTACLSSPKVFKSSYFTYSSVRQDHMAVVGVVSINLNLSRYQSHLFSRTLHTRLVHFYPGLKILPAEVVEKKVGASTYEALMQRYRMDDEMGVDMLLMLRKKLPHIRYVVLAKLGNNRMFHHQEDGGYETPLTLRVHLDVFDLRNGFVAFRGSAAGRFTTRNGYEALPDSVSHSVDWQSLDQGKLVGYYGQAFVEEHQSYPITKTFLVGLDKIFTKLIEQFPA